MESCIIEDQFSIPEDERPFNTPRNPHCRKELWRSQDSLQEQELMKDEKWYPKNTQYNIYNQTDFVKPNSTVQPAHDDIRIWKERN